MPTSQTPVGRVLARSLFGDAGPARVRQALTAFCGKELGSEPAELRFFRMSVGAVFGLRLADGRAVVVKLHLRRERLRRLAAVQRVQRHLTDNGFPCPRPIGEPRRLLELPVTVEEYLGGGEERDAHDPHVRRVIAQTLARLLRLTEGIDEPELAEGWEPYGGNGWGEPHNALFDFGATAAGAEWIDELASAAWPRSQVGRQVVGHTDWVTKHFQVPRTGRGRDLRLGQPPTRLRAEHRRRRGGPLSVHGGVRRPAGRVAGRAAGVCVRVRAGAPVPFHSGGGPGRRGARCARDRLHRTVRACTESDRTQAERQLPRSPGRVRRGVAVLES